MAHNTKKLATDVDGKAIPQYYNAESDSYEVLTGKSGASKVIAYDEDGAVLDFSIQTVEILDKLNDLTGTAMDEEQRKSNESNRETAEQNREASEILRETAEFQRDASEDVRQENEVARMNNYQELLNTGVLQTKINDKLLELETQYAPTLLEKADKSYVDDQLNNLPDPTWDNLQDKPLEFTPIAHTHTIEDVVGLRDELDSVPELNKENVGLGNVDNVKQASKVEHDQLVTDFSAHQADGVAHITNTERNNWNAKETPNGAQTKVTIHANSNDVHGLKNTTLSLGQGSTANGTYAIALGYNSSASGTYTTAMGRVSAATGYGSTALGDSTSAETSGSTAIGRSASAVNNYEGVLGGTGTSATSVWNVPGQFSVAGTKNFEIPHPKPDKKDTHRIRHGAVESPTAGDTLYRYEIEATEDGETVEMQLPDYFQYLNKDVECWVNGVKHFGRAYADVEGDKLKVTCETEGRYRVLVIGTRNDDHESVQDWYIKGVEREIGESWTGETYVFSDDEIVGEEEFIEEEVV